MSTSAQDSVRTLELAIASGAATSQAVDLRGHVPIALTTPAALTSTSAELQASLDDGATWLPVYDRSGNKYSAALAANRWVAIPPGDIAGLPLVRLVTNSNEAAARTLKLVCRALG